MTRRQMLWMLFWNTPLLDVCTSLSAWPQRAFEAVLCTCGEDSSVQLIELLIQRNKNLLLMAGFFVPIYSFYG
jgi:hypothetical protein